MVAYPVLNDGSDIIVRTADGVLVPNGVKDLTLVRFEHASTPGRLFYDRVSLSMLLCATPALA